MNIAQIAVSPAADTAAPLQRAVRFWLSAFVAGLFFSGAAAIPLLPEIDVLARVLHTRHAWPPALVQWIATVQAALRVTDARYPFLMPGIRFWRIARTGSPLGTSPLRLRLWGRCATRCGMCGW